MAIHKHLPNKSLAWQVFQHNPSDTPVEQADTLFFGGGTYFMKPDKTASAFMKNLDPTKIKQIALFTTSATRNGFRQSPDKDCHRKGHSRHRPLPPSHGCKGMKIIGSTGGKLKDEQIELVRNSLKKMLAQ
nr:flavoprotein [Lactiplantibacillus plantarum]